MGFRDLVGTVHFGGLRSGPNATQESPISNGIFAEINHPELTPSGSCEVPIDESNDDGLLRHLFAWRRWIGT